MDPAVIGSATERSAYDEVLPPDLAANAVESGETFPVCPGVCAGTVLVSARFGTVFGTSGTGMGGAGITAAATEASAAFTCGAVATFSLLAPWAKL
jgi:hypothetical protein